MLTSKSLSSWENISDQRVCDVLDYIHARLSHHIQTSELAAVAGVSQFYFCRLFKQAVGFTPYQYVIRQRMESAKTLLKQRKYTIAEIALMVGCTDQSKFSKHFRKHVGITPKTFLDQQLLGIVCCIRDSKNRAN